MAMPSLTPTLGLTSPTLSRMGKQTARWLDAYSSVNYCFAPMLVRWAPGGELNHKGKGRRKRTVQSIYTRTKRFTVKM